MECGCGAQFAKPLAFHAHYLAVNEKSPWAGEKKFAEVLTWEWVHLQATRWFDENHPKGVFTDDERRVLILKRTEFMLPDRRTYLTPREDRE
jgi:hypothetical protein